MCKDLTIKPLIILVVSILTTPIFSQSEGSNYHLTHQLSASERLQRQNEQRSFIETSPPVGSVRAIAEWEPVEGVLIAYDGGFGIPLSMIREMSNTCKVTTIVSGTSEENNVRSIFTANNVNVANCNFVHQDPNSWWTRDYSPWYIAVNDEQVAILDFPYNRPRPNDDNVPVVMASLLGEDLYGMNVIHTGGNMMFDGYGAGASTDLVWEENTSQTQTAIRTKFQNYLGVTNYHVTFDPQDEYIKHIDCWGKFLDVDKILIAQVPTNDYRYSDYEAIAQYYAGQNCSWGYPYQVIRVQEAYYTVSTATPYTNSLILNNKVFVPQTGSSYDAQAINVYQQAMPGYQIIGVNSTGWYNTDALHCRTFGIADRQMLYIHHLPLHGNYANQDNFYITAKVVSYGGSPLLADFPKLTYRVDGGDWIMITMTILDVANHQYQAAIPGLDGTHSVEYYIEAQNDNNKTSRHPTMGSVEPHQFTYGTGLANTILTTSGFSLYPNPTQHTLFIHSKDKTEFEINIISANGQTMKTMKAHQSLTSIDVTDLSTGIYFVRLSTEKGVTYQKLMVE